MQGSLRLETLQSIRPVGERTPFLISTARAMLAETRYTAKARRTFAADSLAELSAWAESHPEAVTCDHIEAIETLTALSHAGWHGTLAVEVL